MLEALDITDASGSAPISRGLFLVSWRQGAEEKAQWEKQGICNLENLSFRGCEKTTHKDAKIWSSLGGHPWGIQYVFPRNLRWNPDGHSSLWNWWVLVNSYHLLKEPDSICCDDFVVSLRTSQKKKWKVWCNLTGIWPVTECTQILLMYAPQTNMDILVRLKSGSKPNLFFAQFFLQYLQGLTGCGMKIQTLTCKMNKPVGIICPRFSVLLLFKKADIYFLVAHNLLFLPKSPQAVFLFGTRHVQIPCHALRDGPRYPDDLEDEAVLIPVDVSNEGEDLPTSHEELVEKAGHFVWRIPKKTCENPGKKNGAGRFQLLGADVWNLGKQGTETRLKVQPPEDFAKNTAGFTWGGEKDSDWLSPRWEQLQRWRPWWMLQTSLLLGFTSYMRLVLSFPFEMVLGAAEISNVQIKRLWGSRFHLNKSWQKADSKFSTKEKNKKKKFSTEQWLGWKCPRTIQHESIGLVTA